MRATNFRMKLKWFLTVIVAVLSFAGNGENMHYTTQDESPPSTPENPAEARIVLGSLIKNNPCRSLKTFARRDYQTRAVNDCITAFKAMKLLRTELLIPEFDNVVDIACAEGVWDWYCVGYITRVPNNWCWKNRFQPRREKVYLTTCYVPRKS